MKKKIPASPQAAKLRRQAEVELKEHRKKTGPLTESEADTRRLVHELQVHQIELEVQNEELIRARAEGEAALSQYTELYDFAPVGYFTLTQDGTISKINLEGAKLLGVERGKLLKRRFGVFVSPSSNATFNTFLEKVFTSRSKETCEVALQRQGTAPYWVNIEAVRSENGTHEREECRAVLTDITERKRVDQQLLESEKRFSVLFEKSAFTAALSKLPDGVLVAVNEAFERTFGFSRQEAVGRTSQELGINPDAEGRARILAALKETGAAHNLELPLRIRSGEERLFSVNVDLVDIGNQNYILNTTQDISERKQAEEALQISETRYRWLHESMRDCFVQTKMSGEIVDVNPAFLEMLGYTEEEVVKLRYQDLTPERWHAFELELVETQILPLGHSNVYEKEYIKKDGTVFPVELRTFLLRDAKGQPSGMWAIVRDISERKRAEDELKLNESRYRMAQALGQVGNWEYNLENAHFWGSDETKKIYGFDPATPEFTTDEVENCIPERQRGHQALLDLIERDSPYNLEFDIITKDKGETKTIRSIAILEKDAEGRPLKVTGVIQDITVRKKIEDEIKEATANLESLLDNRQDSIWSLDRDYRYIIFNKPCAEIMLKERGIHLEKGMNALAVHSEEVREFWKSKFESAFRGENVIFEFTHKINGTDHFFQVFLNPIKTNGNVTGASVLSMDITERKRAETEILRRNTELTALNTLGRGVNQTILLKDVVSEAVNETVEMTHADVSFLFLRDGERLTLAGIAPQSAAEKFGEIPEHRVGECMCGLAVREGKPLYSRDIYTDLRCTWEECKKAGYRSLAALPLRSGTEIIGVVGMACLAEYDFESQSEFLETLASQVSGGIRNAQLYEQAQRRLNELDTIYQAAQRLQILHMPETLAQTLIRILEDNLHYEYGAVLLLDEQSDTLIPFALSEQGQGAEFVELDKAYIASQRVQVGKGITGWVAQTGQSVRLGDAHNDPRYLSMRTDIQSELCVPLRIGSLVIGVINTETSKPDAYTEDDQRMLETIAAQMVVAIQNARLLEQVQRHAAELEQRVAERTAELRQLVSTMAGREVRMAELKDVIRQLRAQMEQAGLTPSADDPLAGL